MVEFGGLVVWVDEDCVYDVEVLVVYGECGLVIGVGGYGCCVGIVDHVVD